MANVKISEISTTTTSPTGNEYVELDSGSGSSKITLSTIRDYIWNYLTSLTAKTTLADADQLSVYVSADSATKKITWANIMTAILAYTGTFTNKRVTKRSVTVTQSATPTINTDNGDVFVITGLAQAITSLTTNLSGTPTNGQMMLMMITDNGTARAITPGSSFVGTSSFSISALTTTINKELKLLWMYSSAVAKWELVGNLSSS